MKKAYTPPSFEQKEHYVSFATKGPSTLSPLTCQVWANFCRLGREMAAPAIAELTRAQMHESRARVAARASTAARGW